MHRNARRNGTTTRNIDRWVQEIFKSGVVYIYERDGLGHTDWPHTEKAYERFLTRMKSEHPFIFEKLSNMSGSFSGVDCIQVVISGYKNQPDYHLMVREAIEKSKSDYVE